MGYSASFVDISSIKKLQPKISGSNAFFDEFTAIARKHFDEVGSHGIEGLSSSANVLKCKKDKYTVYYYFTGSSEQFWNLSGNVIEKLYNHNKNNTKKYIVVMDAKDKLKKKIFVKEIGPKTLRIVNNKGLKLVLSQEKDSGQIFYLELKSKPNVEKRIILSGDLERDDIKGVWDPNKSGSV